VLENKLATRINLEKREIAVESPLCSLCRVEVESNSHLFFECRFVWLVWSRCFAWLGVQFVSHNDPLLNFSQFRLWNVSASANEMWGVIWTAVVRELWKHRNNVIFNGGVVNGLKVVALVQVKVWSWITSKFLSGLFSFFKWCLEPLVCMTMVS